MSTTILKQNQQVQQILAMFLTVSLLVSQSLFVGSDFAFADVLISGEQVVIPATPVTDDSVSSGSLVSSVTSLVSDLSRLLNLEALERQHSFRFPRNTMNYASATMTFDPNKPDEFWIVTFDGTNNTGATPKHEIAKFRIPSTTSNSTNLGDLPEAVMIQAPVHIWGKLTTNPNNNNEIGSLLAVKDPNDPTKTVLILGAFSYYDQTFDSDDQRYTIAVIENPDDLANAKVRGFLALDGAAKRDIASGYMSLIPEDYRDELGGDIMLGSGGASETLADMYKTHGPQASTIKLADLMNPSLASIPTKALADYPLAHSLGGTDLYNRYLTNHIYTIKSGQQGGFVIPGTGTVAFIGHFAGDTAPANYNPSDPVCNTNTTNATGTCGGICYKCEVPYNGGMVKAAGYASTSDDYAPFIWYYRVEDLEKVGQGLLNPWDVTPYAYGRIPQVPGGMYGQFTGGASYNPVTGMVYVTFTGVDEAQPIVMAFQFNLDKVFTTTPPPPDTTEPAISNVASSNITGGGGMITWTTNEPSDSLVEFGINTSHDAITPLNTAKVIQHSVPLSGLAPETLYRFCVISKDSAGNQGMSAEFTFTTTSTSADRTEPVISGLTASNITGSGATIVWATDELSNSRVEYGTSTFYGSSSSLNTAMVANHSQTLSGLAASTLYHYRVISADAAGNIATSGDLTLTTAAPTPAAGTPVIESLEVNAKDTEATFSYVTDIAVFLNILWGTNPNILTSTKTVTPATTGSLTLTGLTAQTTYQYKLYAKNPNNGLYATQTGSFTTAAPAPEPEPEDTTAPVISGLGITNVTVGEATILWATDEPSTQRVEFRMAGHTNWQSTAEDANLALEHSATLTGLSADTGYEFQVISADTAPVANVAISGILSFRTLEPPDTTAPEVSGIATPDTTDLDPAKSGLQVHWGSAVTYQASATDAHPFTYEWIYTMNGGAEVVFASGAGPTIESAMFACGDTDAQYHLMLRVRDKAGNQAEQSLDIEVRDFRAPEISAAEVSKLTHNAATVTWLTDEDADSVIRYGISESLLDKSLTQLERVKTHSLALTGLTPETFYHVEIASQDAAGNLAKHVMTFTTKAPPDVTAPRVSNMRVSSIKTDSLTFPWTTNEPSTSEVKYGTTSALGSTSGVDSTLVTSHSVTLTGLKPATRYHYRVRSLDAAGNTTTSGTFTTKTATPK